MAKKKAKKKVKKKPAAAKITKKKTAGKKRTKKNKGGRRTVYTKKHPEIAIGYAEDGSYTPYLLALKFKVSAQTISNWIKKYSKFAKAVEEGKERAIDLVQLAYFNLARGGLVKTKIKEEPGIIKSKPFKTTTTETMLPSERACKQILAANRDDFKDKSELTGADGGPIKTVLDIINGSTKGKLPADDPKDSSGAS